MPPFLLSTNPIPDTTSPFGPGLGAEVRFLGIVRELEADQEITGIEYTAYLPMASRMLEELIAQGQQDHGPHQVFIQHRLGFVAAAQPSILIWVRTKHSAAAFDLCRWYLQEIKSRVPIWKRPICRSGPAQRVSTDTPGL
jgi:molybdopterin synthase catalytic subunit